MEKCKYCKYCGGCKYQGLDYQEQLLIKQNHIEKLLSKFHFVNKIIGMDNPYNYRNKVQVSFGYDENHNVIYGNYVASTHTIVEVEDCQICDEKANEIINSVARLINKYKISIFDEYAMKGCIRHLLIRCTSKREYMLVIVTGTFNINKKDLFIKDILKYNKSITTIIQNINPNHTSMILGSKNIVLYGKGYVTDHLCGLDFRISASSFYQVNSRQTEILYKQAIDIVKKNNDDLIIDTYCGTGTIGMILAKYAKRVIGVEINQKAVKDAINNAIINKINNIEFICDDASNYMYKLQKSNIKIDTVIMDPPRSGADMRFLKSLVNLKPKRVIYISCGPNSLKDNLDYLTKYYKVESIQPVDMFPFSEHIECVVGMQRN